MKKGPQALLLETPASSEGREKAGVNKQNKTKQNRVPVFFKGQSHPEEDWLGTGMLHLSAWRTSCPG